MFCMGMGVLLRGRWGMFGWRWRGFREFSFFWAMDERADEGRVMQKIALADTVDGSEMGLRSVFWALRSLLCKSPILL